MKGGKKSKKTKAAFSPVKHICVLSKGQLAKLPKEYTAQGKYANCFPEMAPRRGNAQIRYLIHLGLEPNSTPHPVAKLS